ncbi:T9SS type A sorting domain-containing protein [Xanthomarina sp. F2636L]|uniref:T9SS type A sorting domain-containing protein n=1 Tax=Xanthomarina sp. F2636L TaxID=2996018 RepID=UPI00225E0591|nr:T9SS type A sorting domain-containing protein [Xanthomarina sp. F2636L]MCX7550749.1 T9SS type A sorting domain-containing protein [Xanthomarina sp. F2636L]
MIKYLQYVLLIAICFSSNTIFSQTGPGGVGSTDGTSNLVLWLNPDIDGNTNNKWADQSGKGYDFTDGAGAVLNSNTVNGYNAYTFNGTSNYFQKSFENNLNPNEFSVFSATKVLQSSNYKTVLSSRDEYTHWWWADKKYGFMLYAVPNSNNWSFWTGEDNDWRTAGDSQSTAESWSIQSLNYKNGSNGKQLFINNNLNTNSNQGMQPNGNKPFRVGAGRNESTPDYFFKGEMGEIIMYNSVINEAQRIIVNNYLAAKYNLSIADDYYKQDNVDNGNFDHHVAGIGKIDNANAHLDSQGTGIIRISKSGLADNRFLFWGENNKNATYSFSLNGSGDYKEYIDTMWRVSEPIGINSKFRVNIKKSDLNLNSTSGCIKLELVVANNPSFTGSSVNVYYLTETDTEYVYDTDGLGFDDCDYFTLRYVDQIVWNGSQYYNGSRVNYAPNNDSDKCLKLLIKAGNKAVLNQNAYVREIEVEAGAILEVADGVELSVENTIVNNGTIDLLGEAQIIQNHAGDNNNSGTGKIKIRQQGTTNLYNYNYWSSPVNRNGSWQIGFLEQNNLPVSFHSAHNANPNTTPITLSSRWLYSYNASSAIGYYGWLSLGNTTPVLPGIGYTMKGSGSTNSEEEYVFSGEANNGNYTYPVTAGYDFLVGNPYPSALNVKRFIEDNLDVTNGTLYFYEQFESNNTHITRDYQGGYAVRNILAGVAAVSQLDNGGLTSKGAPKEDIAVGQGFFVSIVNNGNLKFKNTQRAFAKESNNGSVFYREETTNIATDTRTKLWLDFTDPLGRSREIALGYDDRATENFDKGYDAIDYSNYPDKMLWYTTDNLLVIQGLNRFSFEDNIPLSVKVTTPGTYTIGLNRTLNFPENTDIYLKDDLENNYYNLTSEDVSFVFDAGTFNDRFSIVYQNETLSVSSIEESQSVYVKFDKNTNTLQLIGVDNLNDIKAAYIYSIDGKQVNNFKSLDSKLFNLPYLSDGVYVLKLEMTSGAAKNIKFLKY